MNDFDVSVDGDLWNGLDLNDVDLQDSDSSVDNLSGSVDSQFQVDDNLLVDGLLLQDDFQFSDNLSQVFLGLMDVLNVMDHLFTVFDDS